MCNTTRRGKQKGVVLIVTLLVLLAMTIATVGLIYSTDTSLMALGNVTLRQSANASATTAIEQAVRNIAAIDFAGPLPIGYYGNIQNNESASGIPAVLSAGGDAGVILSDEDVAGNTTRTVVERMCNAVGNCLAPIGAVGIAGVTDDPNKTNELLVLELNRNAAAPGFYYRVTVRVDGPKNTLSYLQSIIMI